MIDPKFRCVGCKHFFTKSPAPYICKDCYYKIVIPAKLKLMEQFLKQVNSKS